MVFYVLFSFEATMEFMKHTFEHFWNPERTGLTTGCHLGQVAAVTCEVVCQSRCQALNAAVTH